MLILQQTCIEHLLCVRLLEAGTAMKRQIHSAWWGSDWNEKVAPGAEKPQEGVPAWLTPPVHSVETGGDKSITCWEGAGV